MAEPAEWAAEDSHPTQPVVTLAEAAAMTGRPAEAIRAMIRRGKLKALKGNDGRTLVAIPAEMIQPPGHPGHGQGGHLANGAAAEDGQASNSATAEDSRVAGLAMAVEEWRAAAEEARLTAAVAAARLASAERAHLAEVATAAAKVETAERLITELQKMLAEARRPWWRRWLG
jgi:hypothetical protein